MICVLKKYVGYRKIIEGIINYLFKGLKNMI